MQHRFHLSCLFPLLPALLLTACSSTATPEEEESTVVQRGDRRLVIDLNEGSGESYEDVVQLARSIGARGANLSLGWQALETAPGVYDPEVDLLGIAEAYYPAHSIPLLLMIGPIDTNVDQLPDDLKGKSFDDPEVVARYIALLDYVFAKIPTLELDGLSIGNEVDIYLGSDTAAWGAYARFVDTVVGYVRSVRPDLPVGVKMTLDGLTGPFSSRAERVNRRSDIILATHYPLGTGFQVEEPEVLEEDVATLVGAYPDRPIRLAELGYPSGAANGSSPQKQGEFIREAFRVWDRYAEHIVAISFSIMTDRSQQEVEEFGRYYGLDDPAFLSFLRTLGLREADGREKEGWRVLVEELEKRGW